MKNQLVANLANGNTLCFEAPSFGNFQPEPAFRQMSFINRWAGNLTREYSVLQHSLIVADAIDEPHLKIYGLIHDVPECGTGDVTGPYKAFIDQMTGGQVEAHETTMLNQLCVDMGLAPLDLTTGRKLHRADMVARATELRDVVANPSDIQIKYDPLPFTIPIVPREELIIQALDAYHTYLDLYHQAYPVADHG